MSRKDKGKAKEVKPDSDDEEIYEEWTGVGSGGDGGYEGLEDDQSDGDEEAGLPSFAKMDQEDMDQEDSEAELESEESFNGELEHGKPRANHADIPDDLLPEWKGINLHTLLKRALLAMDFIKPTEIQKRAIGPGITGRDLVGVAETASRS